jgi:D-alanine-D-alanine ligase
VTQSSPRVSVLYQALEPPVIDGIRKPKKPGGYSDSGADIAYALRNAGVDVVTPVASPEPAQDLDWVFPDTIEGIDQALAHGATALWANTILFEGHPLEAVIDRGIQVVGPAPALVHRFDDKWVTNELLRVEGCPVAPSVLVSAPNEPATGLGLDHLTPDSLSQAGVELPVVVKPVRGRGSEAVQKIDSLEDLRRALTELFEASLPDGSSRYGTKAIVETYLSGTEVTVTVMPPGRYRFDGHVTERTDHWALPIVERFNHIDGIAPYNGVVAVTRNSRLVSHEDSHQSELRAQCERAGAIIGSTAPIRIDCRAADGGSYLLFDVNLKPNMTGPGRPGRDDQDSLSLIAASGVGWGFEELLLNMLDARTAPLTS